MMSQMPLSAIKMTVLGLQHVDHDNLQSARPGIVHVDNGLDDAPLRSLLLFRL